MREKEHKKKGREILKVLGISAVAIGLFVAVFIGINSLAFNASTNNVENMPTAVEPVAIPDTSVPPEGFQEPELTVIVPEPELAVSVRVAEIAVNKQELGLTINVQDSQRVPSANSISPQEAAIIGAQYIWQMFGEWIDGKYVTLHYSAHPSHTRTYWFGNVTEMEQEQVSRDTDNEGRMQIAQAVLFSFSIDAITGEWIDIFGSIESRTPDEVIAVLEEMRQHPGQSEIYEARIAASLTPAILERHAQIAREHASRHFVHSEVVSVEFSQVSASGFGFDENRNIVATSFQLLFEATDSTGRVAYLSFDEATGDLFYLMTMHNDFVPGFRYEISENNSEGLG